MLSTARWHSLKMIGGAANVQLLLANQQIAILLDTLHELLCVREFVVS